MSKVTVKGQVTIPKEVRDHMNIRPGSEVEFVRQGEYFAIVKKTKKNVAKYLEQWKGVLTAKKEDKGDVDDLIHAMRGGSDRR